MVWVGVKSLYASYITIITVCLQSMEKFNLMMRKEDLNVIIHISYKNAKHTDRWGGGGGGGGSQKHVCILHNFASYITLLTKHGKN